jgi:Zn-dependent membrane protease YugP
MDIWVLYLIGGIGLVFSLMVRWRMLSTYKKWHRPNMTGLSGGATAGVILDANGMHDVRVVPAPGRLTDHYDPRRKIIRLSKVNYASPTVAAMAVSAHEAGHAIQDAKDYFPLEIRTAIAPLVNFAARFGIPAAILGGLFGMPLLITIGILAYVGALLFQFLALPVEYDASRRALKQLRTRNLATESELEGVRAVLRAAALTYVAGVAAAAGFVVFIAISGGRALLGRKPPLPPSV